MRYLYINLISLIILFGSVSHSEIHTSLLSQGLSFISSDYQTTDSKNFAFLGATLNSDNISDDAFKINLTAQYAVGNSVLSFLNVREIYYNDKVNEHSVLYAGRKLLNWSSLDTIWNLGVFQPQFKWNPLLPENQGLTGLFWNSNYSGLGLTLFASPLYIPDQGASYELKEGQFQSVNPWFSAPPQNVKFQGQLLPIDYEILKPETNSVIFQTQYGAQLRLGEGAGYFANFAGIYKPANQMALGYKGVLVTTRVRVDVKPKLYFENAYSADFGLRGDWGIAQLSLLCSKPVNPEFESGYNSPEFEQSLSWGPQIFYKLKPFDFFVGYLDTSGGEIKDVGPDASPDRQSLSQRFLFKQALQVQATYSDLFLKRVKLTSSVQFKTSSKEGFRQIKIKNKLDLRGHWAFWFDILLIDTDSSVPTNIEPYKSLDQLWLGVSYDL